VATSQTEFPALDSRYEDEYGPIDLKVYDAARAIWPAAETFGTFALQDQAVAFNFMLQAAAKVTARIASGGPEIQNLGNYLFRTYKHLIAQERVKRLQRAQPLSGFEQSPVVEIAEDLERKIMLRELFSRMSETERTLSEYLMLGYTYEEIAKQMDTTAEALRARFGRLKHRLQSILTAK